MITVNKRQSAARWDWRFVTARRWNEHRLGDCREAARGRRPHAAALSGRARNCAAPALFRLRDDRRRQQHGGRLSRAGADRAALIGAAAPASASAPRSTPRRTAPSPPRPNLRPCRPPRRRHDRQRRAGFRDAVDPRRRAAGPDHRRAGHADLPDDRLRLRRRRPRRLAVRPAGVRQHLHPHHQPDDRGAGRADGGAGGRAGGARRRLGPRGAGDRLPRADAAGRRIRRLDQALRRLDQPVQSRLQEFRLAGANGPIPTVSTRSSAAITDKTKAIFIEFDRQSRRRRHRHRRDRDDRQAGEDCR